MINTTPYKPYFFNTQLFVIAEIGGNHEGDPEYASKLLDLACNSGAHAIKFQIYNGDKIVSKVENEQRNKHFKKFELDYSIYESLAQKVKSRGLEFMSSLWDDEAFKHFDPLINIHKIGSGDLTNYPLIKKIALTNKPLIIATAMSTIEDIKDCVAYIDRINPNLRKENKLCLMHCVAMYGDLKDEYANLLSIRFLQASFPDIHIGYSDHTIGTKACEVAVAMGSRVLELHFTDDKTREFRDHALSVTKEEMQNLIVNCHKIIKLQGKYDKQPIAEIENSERIKEFRRAVYLVQDLPAGTEILEKHLNTLRPNNGIDAREYEWLIGKKSNKPLKALAALNKNDFSD
jgi:N,N'-diacetyllegionaminate synthase